MRVAVVLFSQILTSTVISMDDDARLRRSMPDGVAMSCGATSVFYLLRLEGRVVDAATLNTELGQEHTTSQSLGNLRDVALNHGVRLVGVTFTQPNVGFDRPTIVFLNRPPHGHFITLNPVGHSGKLIQVLDGLKKPSVLDIELLMSSPEWTGIALIPERPNWPAWIAGGLAVVSASILGFMRIAPRVRKAWRSRGAWARGGDARRDPKAAASRTS